MRVLLYKDLKPEKGINFSKTHIGRLEDAGLFPKRFYIGAGQGTAAWLEKEIDQHIVDRAAVRDAVNGKAAAE